MVEIQNRHNLCLVSLTLIAPDNVSCANCCWTQHWHIYWSYTVLSKLIDKIDKMHLNLHVIKVHFTPVFTENYCSPCSLLSIARVELYTRDIFILPKRPSTLHLVWNDFIHTIIFFAIWLLYLQYAPLLEHFSHNLNSWFNSIIFFLSALYQIVVLVSIYSTYSWRQGIHRSPIHVFGLWEETRNPHRHEEKQENL